MLVALSLIESNHGTGHRQVTHESCAFLEAEAPRLVGRFKLTQNGYDGTMLDHRCALARRATSWIPCVSRSGHIVPFSLASCRVFVHILIVLLNETRQEEIQEYNERQDEHNSEGYQVTEWNQSCILHLNSSTPGRACRTPRPSTYPSFLHPSFLFFLPFFSCFFSSGPLTPQGEGLPHMTGGHGARRAVI